MTAFNFDNMDCPESTEDAIKNNNGVEEFINTTTELIFDNTDKPNHTEVTITNNNPNPSQLNLSGEFYWDHLFLKGV